MDGSARSQQSRAGKHTAHPVIMHLDMDAFFVSVELLARPELTGQKIIVARESERSVVLSASYEARTCGVHSAMPLSRAKQLCPEAVVVEPNGRYRDYSHKVMAILRDVTDRVEQVSIDEAFVDLTPTLRRLGNPVHTAQRVRQRIATELKLPSSAGIASTKFIAKMASSGSKPNGLWAIPPHRVQEFLDPLPVGKLWGVGPKSARSLESLGIRTVLQLRECEADYLTHRFGRSAGAHLYNISRGIDSRPVLTERIEKSIGAEHTFAQDTTDHEIISREVYRLSLAVGRRLRSASKHAYSLSLKIRFDTFETLTRACPLDSPTDSGREIYQAVMKKLEELEIMVCRLGAYRPLRLIGVRAEKLDERALGVQETLLGEGLDIRVSHSLQNWHEAESAMDQIQQKFGVERLMPAKLLEGKE